MRPFFCDILLPDLKITANTMSRDHRSKFHFFRPTEEIFMNRAELIDALAQETKSAKAECERWLAAFISTVTTNARKADGVKLVGFGTFTTAKRKARTGRNPQTGKAIKIPARTVPVFRAGALLKGAVNKK